MEKDKEDDILSRRKFQNASGINLGNFMLDAADETEEEESIEEVVEEVTDVAVGELGELFRETILLKESTATVL